MSATLIMVFVLVLLLVVQNLLTSGLLRDLETTDPAAHNGLDLNRENFWNHTQPLRISFGYVLPGTYKKWNLSNAGRVSATLLRLVSVGVLLVFLLVIGKTIVESI